jgi:hypothetical protein
MIRHRKATPRRLVIDCPDPLTLKILHAYGERHSLDLPTAAEHLIARGASAWANARKAGQARAALDTADERRTRARDAIATRWQRQRARATASPPE